MVLGSRNCWKKTTHHITQAGRLPAIFMLGLSSTSTDEEMTSRNWIVLDIVHRKWHIIYRNEYILLRANMIDRPVVELTLRGTEHNKLIFFFGHVSGHAGKQEGQCTRSSEHSVDECWGWNNAVFKTSLCWFSYTHCTFCFCSHYSAAVQEFWKQWKLIFRHTDLSSDTCFWILH